jgi:hypothetical protein
MSDEPNSRVREELARWDWLRGFLGTSMLLLVVITVASGIFQYRVTKAVQQQVRPSPNFPLPGPIESFPPSAKWPFIEWDRIVAVCTPATVFWFWFFARYRRPEEPALDESKASDRDSRSETHERVTA